MLSLLFPLAFRSLLVDLKKKNQNEFCKLRVINLKINVYFFALIF